jgi:hypothetical protein
MIIQNNKLKINKQSLFPSPSLPLSPPSLPPSLSARRNSVRCMSYEEEDTCMSYEEDTFVSCKEDTFMALKKRRIHPPGSTEASVSACSSPRKTELCMLVCCVCVCVCVCVCEHTHTHTERARERDSKRETSGNARASRTRI